MREMCTRIQTYAYVCLVLPPPPLRDLTELARFRSKVKHVVDVDCVSLA